MNIVEMRIIQQNQTERAGLPEEHLKATKQVDIITPDQLAERFKIPTYEFHNLAAQDRLPGMSVGKLWCTHAVVANTWHNAAGGN